MKKISLYLKHAIPWVIAAGIFAYLFHLYPPAQVWNSLKYVNIPVFAAFAVVYFLIVFVVDVWVMKCVISKFSHPVPMGDTLAARGATYLVMVVNYPASQAAFAYYLKRRYKIPIFEALGIFLFIVFIDFLWIVSLAFVGSFFQSYSVGGVVLNRTVQTFGLTVYALTFVWLGFWRRWFDHLAGRHVRIPIIERLRKRRVFHIFDRARVSDYLRTAAMRIPIHLTIIISMYVVLLTFGAHAPFLQILGNIPLVFLVGVLPITPGGLGTTNAVLVELLSPYLSGPLFASGEVSPKELLFTATLLWMFANYLMKVITGVVMLRRVSKNLFKPTTDVPEEKAEHEAAHIGGNI
jgi:uncharacterized membrane protein YbhN (UPF0104 family)